MKPLIAAALACAVCYGDPSSNLVQGAKAGVLFMAGMIYGLLFLIGGVIVYWIRRARALEAAAEAERVPSAD